MHRTMSKLENEIKPENQDSNSAPTTTDRDKVETKKKYLKSLFCQEKRLGRICQLAQAILEQYAVDCLTPDPGHSSF